jgi:alkylmercury lyase
MQPTESIDVVLDVAAQLGFLDIAQRQADLSPALKSFHQTILRAFLDEGSTPTHRRLVEQASRISLDHDDVVARLSEIDLLHVSEGVVRVAYPFSGVPTSHGVRLENGRKLWAMCALDALGILLMAKCDGTIISADPQSKEPIQVERHRGEWLWQPDEAVVVVGSTNGCARVDQGACPNINFHGNAHGAVEHLNVHPEITGHLVSQAVAIELADRIFGSLLDP